MAESTFGQSPFSYTLNNPVNIVDEFGLEGSGWNTRGRQETEAETANREQMDNPSIKHVEIIQNPGAMTSIPDFGSKGWYGAEKTVGNVLSYTDANDITVLITTLTRKGNAVNLDGTNATFSDKMWAAGGLIIPAASGSAIKKVGGKLINNASDFIHGNSKLSQKIQHGYEIFNKKTQEILEYGISGQSRTAKQILNKTSPRIMQKLLTKYRNNPEIGGRVIKDNLANRLLGLDWEQIKVNKFAKKNGGIGPNQQKLPTPKL